MGALLDQWMADNSAALARLAPGGGMGPQVGGPPPPAFPGAGEGAMAPPPPQAFQGGQGPVAAPVSVQGTPGAQVGEFGPYQAPPMAQPAFEAEPTGGGGPGVGSAVMQAIEDRRGAGEEAPPPDGKKPVEEGDVTDEADIELPAEGEGLSAEQVMSASPEAVDKAVEMLEEQTGQEVEQLYEQQTGNPPPADMRKREIGSFLLEFGLNLLAQPGGMSPAQELGSAAQQTMTGRRGRREAATAAESEARQQRFENKVKAGELGLREREMQRLEAQGDFTHFAGDDGKMWSFDGNTGEITRAVDQEGNPISAPAGGSGTTSAGVQRFNRTFESAKRRASIMEIPFNELAALRDAQEAMLRGDTPRTDSAIRRSAMDNAIESVPKPWTTDEWEYLEPEEQAQQQEQYRGALDRMAEMYFNHEKHGSFDVQEGVEPGEAPDPARLTQGEATPVTNNETGEIEYWTVDADGNVRKVSEDELAR